MMLIFAFALTLKELSQIVIEKSDYQTYQEKITNWVDILSIVSTVMVAVSLLREDQYDTMPWLSNFVHMVVLITWIQFCKDLMGCLPGSSIGLTLNMFAHVASSYIKVIACFAPFLVAFAYTFHGKKERLKILCFFSLLCA